MAGTRPAMTRKSSALFYFDKVTLTGMFLLNVPLPVAPTACGTTRAKPPTSLDVWIPC
jgi:hypothetical protein